MATETAKLQAGAKLDALVAQQVMGWTEGDYRVPHDRDEESDMHQTRWFDGDKATQWMVSHRYAYRGPHMFCPSTDIAAAWQVLRRVRELDLGDKFHDALAALIPDNGNPEWVLLFGDVPAPLLICHAALATVQAAE